MALDYLISGWRVSSEIRLPDLLEWQGDDRRPDLRIVIGSIPPRLADIVVDHRRVQMSADGTVRYDVAAVAVFRIEPDGRTIVIQPRLAITAPDIRVFLLGTVFALACFRAGRLVLHASCVLICDRAVAFTGPSGAGKSTIAAGFLGRGSTVLADDIGVLEVSSSGSVTIWPSYPRMKLWGNALDFMERDRSGLERGRPHLDKFLVPVADHFDPTPRTLAALYHIEHATGTDFRPVPLTDGAALAWSHRAIYRLRLWHLLGGVEEAFRSAAAVSAAIRSYRLPVRRDFAELGALVDRVVSLECHP